jgi:hypothetical protein
VGRGHDKDVRITDISVSRFHALIKKNSYGEYYLEDNNSKFGTLVQVKKPYMMISNMVNCFQIGRTLLEVCLVEKSEGCCTQISQVFGKKNKKKVAKSSLAYDGEDFFPEDFICK